MQVEMVIVYKGVLYFDNEKISFDLKEDDLLDDDKEDKCMVDTKGSL